MIKGNSIESRRVCVCMWVVEVVLRYYLNRISVCLCVCVPVVDLLRTDVLLFILFPCSNKKITQKNVTYSNFLHWTIHDHMPVRRMWSYSVLIYAIASVLCSPYTGMRDVLTVFVFPTMWIVNPVKEWHFKANRVNAVVYTYRQNTHHFRWKKNNNKMLFFTS